MSTAETEQNTLLVIKSLEQNLLPVESFLRNRGWELHTATDLKEAIVMMLQHKPAFVMISVDHPNKKVLKLSKVITQAFPCCLIAFAEKAATGSYKLLSEASTEYLIYPPVTGPAVERTVNKFYKDQAAAGVTLSTNEKNYSTSSAAADGVVNIRGKGGPTLQSLMAQVMGEEISGISYMPDQENITMASGYNPEHNSVNLNGGNSTSQDSAERSVGNGLGQKLKSPLNGGALISPEDSRQANAGYLPEYDSTQRQGDSGAPENRLQTNSGYMPEYDSGSQGPPGFQPDNTSLRPGENFRRHSQKPSLDTAAERRRLGISDESIVPTRHFNDSIILKGSREALGHTTVKGKAPQDIQKLESTSEVSCILIDSPKFSGYLLTAMDRNAPMKEDFINVVRERLYKFLAANGENISDQKNMQLQLRQVPFEDWAIEQAEFLCKSHHNKNEVAMAFFPYKDVFAPVADSAHAEMYSVEVSLLEPDAPVKCNIYIYLPTNNKYILYTPQGGKLYSKQLEKLNREGISHVHILKDEVHDFHAYRAQNYLNGKIGEFQNQNSDQSAKL